MGSKKWIFLWWDKMRSWEILYSFQILGVPYQLRYYYLANIFILEDYLSYGKTKGLQIIWMLKFLLINNTSKISCFYSLSKIQTLTGCLFQETRFPTDKPFLYLAELMRRSIVCSKKSFPYLGNDLSSNSFWIHFIIIRLSTENISEK